jgi:hypothetical protein
MKSKEKSRYALTIISKEMKIKRCKKVHTTFIMIFRVKNC